VRLLLDTSVVVSAFRSRSGASYRLLELFDEDRYRLVATPTLFKEYETVLSRPEHRVVHGLSPRQLEEALKDLASRLVPVKVYFQWRPQLRDHNDEMVLEAAINGLAEIIVTHNVRDFLPAAGNFGIEVMTPGRILRERFANEHR
jgi:putative PIN family toxin of toxin-antitoxin system